MNKGYYWAFGFLVVYISLVLGGVNFFVYEYNLMFAPQCGNNLCEVGETFANCSADCWTTSILPDFAISYENGDWVRYYAPSDFGVISNNHTFEDSRVRSTLVYAGEDIWELEIISKGENITEVTFPWQTDELKLNGDDSDDVHLLPFQLGDSALSTKREAFGWAEYSYPNSFAPIAVQTDNKTARMIAAVNWPQRKTSIAFSKNRLLLRWDESEATNEPDNFEIKGKENRSYSLMVSEMNKTYGDFREPWHKVVDEYRDWLISKMESEGLYPLEYPDWMVESHGFQNEQLENFREWDSVQQEEILKKWEDYLPWVQYWGQMSNYPDPDFTVKDDQGNRIYLPYDGENPPVELYDGVPDLAVGEDLGCCLPNRSIHPRYTDIYADENISELNMRLMEYGWHVGFYSRPYSSGGFYYLLDDPKEYYEDVASTAGGIYGETPLGFFVDWQDKNRLAGSNAHYFDVLGAEYFGDMRFVAKVLTNGTLSENHFIESPVDVYPSAFLASGSVRNDATAKGLTYEDFNETFNKTMFPRFGRYLLRDRLMFMGESNGDYKFMGAGNDYGVERLAFLLGSKIDIGNVFESYDDRDTMNFALNVTIYERERIDFWNRGMVYYDTVGIERVEPGMRVVVFRDEFDFDVLAIDNYYSEENVSVIYKGVEYNMTIPDFPGTNEPSKLYFYEINQSFCGNGVCEPYESENNCGSDCAFPRENESPDSPGGGDDPAGGDSQGSAPEDGEDCVPDWACDGWGECLDGFENRECSDLNGCDVLDGKPEVSRVCEPELPVNPGQDDRDLLSGDSGRKLSRVFIYGLLGALIIAFAILMYRLRKSLFHLEQKEREVVELAKNGLR